MHQRWSDFAPELESGDSDRVNDVIDDINDMDLDERLELFNSCFDELAQLYEAADDGYVRQSVVRVANQLIPGLPTVMALDNDDRSIGTDEAELQDQTDALCGFLLEALTDDDGRVRQAAKRGLKDVFRTYDALDDEATLEALVIELDDMAGETSGTQAKHLREAKEEAKSSLQSGVARLVEGFHEEFGDSLQNDM
jgi:hypothetical protein